MDFDGNVVWHRDLGEIENYHGPAGSPLLYGDTIIIYQDQGASFGAGGINRGRSAGAFVIALDAESGETRWRTDRSASVGWGSPIAISLGDHDELIVSSSRQVQLLRPDHGRRNCGSCDGNLFEVIPTPVVGHGLVFCTSGRAGPTLGHPSGWARQRDREPRCLDDDAGLPVRPLARCCTRDYLYTLNDMSSIVTCLNARTGETCLAGTAGPAATGRPSRRRRSWSTTSCSSPTTTA